MNIWDVFYNTSLVFMSGTIVDDNLIINTLLEKNNVKQEILEKIKLVVKFKQQFAAVVIDENEYLLNELQVDIDFIEIK